MANTTEERTIQSNIKNHNNDDLLKYALFTGGLNVTHDVLANYDPLRTGYGRLFMVRQPVWLQKAIPTKLKKFKHILEYGNTAVSGLNDITVSFNDYTGGYAGKSFGIPSVATDGTDTFTVNCYEFSGSPIREVIWTWVNGTTDLLTGLSHYNGIDPEIQRLQSNQTAEFVYVSTDHTGEQVEYACFLANCFPQNVKNDHFNYSSGQHEMVEYNIEFRCTKYESLQINKLGKALLDRYKVLANSLNFFSGISSLEGDATGQLGDRLGPGKEYDVTTGQLVDAGDAAITHNDNTPLSDSELANM